MAASKWFRAAKDSKKLTVFATERVTKGTWKSILERSITEFNRLSAAHDLGVTLEQTKTPPNDASEAGANIQFDTGSGKVTAKFQDVEQSHDFSPTELHGFTKLFSMQFGKKPPEIYRAFVFVPATPKIQGVTAKFEPGPIREVGDGIKIFIAVHEFVHAVSGLGNNDHTICSDADIFVGPPICTPSASGSRNPSDDKIIVGTNPNIKRFPPITMNPTTIAGIQAAWK